jgi:hypothetical protein
VELEEEMLTNIRRALLAHAAECCQDPKAILLHPGNHALIGWDEVLGLPVLADERVSPKRFLLVCGHQGWGGLFEGKRVWWTEDGSPHHLEDEAVEQVEEEAS